MKNGDLVEVEISGIGRLINPIVQRRPVNNEMATSSF